LQLSRSASASTPDPLDLAGHCLNGGSHLERPPERRRLASVNGQDPAYSVEKLVAEAAIVIAIYSM
jgi:hypothetical protein